MVFARILKLALTLFAVTGGESFAAGLPHFSLPIVNTDQPVQYFDSTKVNAHLLIEFYFNGCPACNQNAPKIEKIGKEFHGEKTKILEIGVDCEAEEYAEWMKKHPPSGLILNSCDGTIQDELGVNGYPTSFIFDCSGKQLFKHVGVWSSSAAEQARKILTDLQLKRCDID